MATILCLHGLGGTGRTMQPLADALTALGHTVHTPTLPGHGSEPDDLLGVTWNDWVDAADAAVTACGAQVVVGQSMGAAIALAVAARRRHHDTLSKLVAINCPAPDPDAIDGLEWQQSRGVEWIDGPPLGDGEEGYTRFPITSLLAMVDGVLATGLAGVTLPVLLVTSAFDEVVDPSSADTIAGGLGGPVTRLLLPNSGHVATHGPDLAMLVATVNDFV